MKKTIIQFFLMQSALFFFLNSYCQNSIILSKYDSAGVFSWVCPPNLDTIVVECWGGGGGGGGVSLQLCAKGTVGGGGGAYSKTKVPVIPGNTYSLTVGQGGNGGYSSGSNGFNGGTTSFKYLTQTLSFASGGAGGGGIANGNCWVTNQAGTGGTSGSGIVYSGGNGSPNSGGGGASGSLSGAGQNSTGNVGGIAGFGGGNGGNGGLICNNPCFSIGSIGSKPGGGGGGTYVSNTQNGSLSPINATGGKGASGQIIISVQKKIYGLLYNDFNQNCIKDNFEPGLANFYLNISPGNKIVSTDNLGQWFLDSLTPGNYSINYNVPNNWSSNCTNQISFNVPHIDSVVQVSSFGIYNNLACSSPELSIYAPTLRRCFSNQIIYVSACNSANANGSLINSYTDITLNNYLNVQNSSIPFTNIGNNKYRFQLGNINPGQCINFTIATNVSCNAPNGMTLCMEAELFPADSCVFDTIPNPPSPDNPILPGGGTFQPCSLPWDKSSLSVDGFCQNDTVCFTITNTGQPVGGDMECYSPVRVYVDGVLTYFDSVMIAGGQTVSYCYPGNGQTWILQADQHPLHPGNSHPNAHVEACGNTANWTPGGVNTFPLDDADPIKDIYCGTVTGSYDPNDKTGYPLGLGTQNYIHPNQQFQYVIRFQNTGNDTAFTVVIRDTLDINLNIFSVVPGVSSHPYQFKMYGPRILEWTFNNIMLPDSNVNEPASNGFVTFIVEQVPNLSNGTVINNDADIYFDFNAPITTNETKHTINDATQSNPVVTNLYELDTNINKEIKIYPNPTSASFKYEITGDDSNRTISIYDFTGKKIYDGKTSHKSGTIDCSSFNSGIYYLIIDDGINILKQKIVIIN